MRWAVLILAGALTLAGCTASRPDPVTTTTPGGSSPSPACPDVTGREAATDGTLSAGPFTSEAIAPNPYGVAYKIWVGSTTAGPPEVTILTYPPGSSTARTYRRTELGQVPDLAMFFPGLIEIPSRGTWLFRVRYAGDELCFKVTYPSA
jgi:ABC-type glycerol-3-phosphate transport system substrate-binding protein